MDGVISEASMYGIQYTADNDVRFYQSRKQELSNYDAQMNKNEISDRLSDQLFSSLAVESIGIYWKPDSTFIQTGHDSLAKLPSNRSLSAAGRPIITACIIFQSTPTSISPKTRQIFNTSWG